ncbi:hypothetical protein CVAR_0884 [Corynebacterium variabile DSM 44702]|uniref:Uncharacterized protein n=1 Tax=Corynebacterium variabile (strain DSM 44702 / CIP 107183 / JCM 12073 / NCIMB 30131) TaxID=858619 RepID=G0HC74_CORVD|nr:hypothetical protein [Corynebacterium variabile]AEK36236.1 hypothetical protein CVAR_0884 [Corynebacterium variabile DSM 44702]
MVEFCTIKRALAAYRADGADDGTDPDKVAVQGKVTLTPVLSTGAVTMYEDGALVTVPLQSMEARIQNGKVRYRGAEGIRVVAGGQGMNPKTIVYKATFTEMQAGGWSFKLPAIQFEAVPGGEVDLTLVAPAPNAPDGVVRGPAGTSISDVLVEGTDLVVMVTDESGTRELSRLPLDDVVRAEAQAAAQSVKDELAAELGDASESASKAKAEADRATEQASAASGSADAAVLAQGDAAASADHAEERAEWSETSANNAAESEALALEHSQVTVGKITTGVEVIDLKDKLLSGVLLTGDGGSSAASTTATVVRCGATCTLVLNRVNRSETTWGEVLPAGSVPVEWLPVDADGKTLSFAGHLFCGGNGDSAELIIRQTGGVYVSSMVTGQSYSGSVSWPAPSMELPIADAVLDIKADVEASASAAARSEQSAFEYAQSAAQVAQLEVERLVNGAPEALDTLSELAVALEDQQDAVAVLVSTISEKPSKEYVDAVKTTADAALPASKIQVVAALPESPVEGTIYLVTGA